MRYRITLEQRLQGTFTVEANSQEEAEEKAEEAIGEAVDMDELVRDAWELVGEDIVNVAEGDLQQN